MAESKDVVFRRINGRIVPIRKRKGPRVAKSPKTSSVPARRASRKEKMESEAAVKAAGFTSSGFGLATAGGLLSGGFFRRARQQRQLSFDFGKGQAGMSAQEGLLPGANLFKKAKKTKIFGRKTATASKLVGGALIGRGLQQGAVALGAQETDASVVASAVAGEAAAFSVAAGVRKVARGTSFRTTFARAAKTVARKKFKLPL